MKKKAISIILSIALAFPLTGCTMMTPLTASEENDIALYAASTVAKYNVKQLNGVCFFTTETEKQYDAREKAREEERKRKEEERKAIEEAEKGGKKPASSDDGSGTSQDPGNKTSAQDNPEPVSQETTLTLLMAEDPLKFSVTKTEVLDHYTVEGVLDLSPGSGKSYFAVTITAANSGGAVKTLNLANKGLKYSCTIGSTAVMSSGNGFLPNDFNTWTGDIPAGGTKEFLLLFPFKNSELNDTSSFMLKALKDGTIFRITE